MIDLKHRVDIYRVAKDPIYVMKIFTVHLHSFVRKTRFRQYIIFKFRAVRLSRGQFMSRSLNYLEGGRVGPGFSLANYYFQITYFSCLKKIPVPISREDWQITYFSCLTNFPGPISREDWRSTGRTVWNSTQSFFEHQNISFADNEMEIKDG